MVNNNNKIWTIGLISKHTTNFPQTTPIKTTTQESYLKAMMSMD